jgi:hypothetical protein
MTARVKRQAVLVLTWIMVTTSATAMAWWSVTFVTKEVADRRPLRPSDVVAASVRQVVPVPAWVYGGPQPTIPSGERMVTPVTAVVVEAVAAVPTQPAAPPATPSTTVARKATAGRGSHPVTSPVSTTPVTAAVQVASVPQASAKLTPPVVPDPAPRSGEVADLPVSSAAVLASPNRFHHTHSTTTVAPRHHRRRSTGSTVSASTDLPG